MQMEAAMKKKEEEAAAPAESPAKAKAPEAVPQVPDKLAGEDDDQDEEIMYGHKDDVVWSDKSHADKEAETAGGEEDISKVRYFGWLLLILIGVFIQSLTLFFGH